MSQLTISIPDDKDLLVANSFDAAFPGRVDAGMTKAQWVKFQTIQWLRAVVRREQYREAEAAIPAPSEVDLT